MLNECCMLAGQDASKKRPRSNIARQHGPDGGASNKIDSPHDTTSQCQCRSGRSSGSESCSRRGTTDFILQSTRVYSVISSLLFVFFLHFSHVSFSVIIYFHAFLLFLGF